jgi:iron(III) transport system ATP-binding protein
MVGMTPLADRYPDQLSGGQQQRVALARALAPSPRIVLLDEPFANLDAGLRLHLRQEVREILRTARTTAILVTHDQEEALSLADRVAVMQNGRVLQVDGPEQVYHRPASIEVAELIGGGQLLDCAVENGRLASPLGGQLATGAPDGAARLLVRPEDLRLLSDVATEGVSGVLGSRRFYGHDVLVDVRLSSGPVVQVRLPGSADEQPKRHVRVVLRPGNFRLFLLAGGPVHRAVAGSDLGLPRLSSA